MSEGFVPKHGGYANLLSYRKSEIVFDATYHFCERFISVHSRTHDQMIQAARSGKQNIVEASRASGTSKEAEIKLTNVARASLEELLVDYQDFLRLRKLVAWSKDDPEALEVRRLGANKEATYGDFAHLIEQGDQWTSANTIISLIHQANYLLDRQMRSLEAAFIKEGGLRERMTRARLEQRNKDRGQ